MSQDRQREIEALLLRAIKDNDQLAIITLAAGAIHALERLAGACERMASVLEQDMEQEHGKPLLRS